MASLEERIGDLVSKERENIARLLEVKEKLHRGYTKATAIQRLFREGAEEDVAFMQTSLSQMHCCMQTLSQENDKHHKKMLEIKNVLSKAGIRCLSSVQQEIDHIK